MATSSIFANIELKDPGRVRAFADAFEMVEGAIKAEF